MRLLLFIILGYGLHLSAQTYATLPFEDTFESGALSNNWRANADTNNGGVVEVISAWGIDNSFGLRLGKTSDGPFATNSIDLFLNLGGQSDVFFSFALRDFFDENHQMDGIFFSNNGGTSFTKVYTFRPEDWCNDLWGRLPPFSVDDLARNINMSLTNRFVIRIQQHDNADFNTSFDEDGFIIDNFKVYRQSPQFATLPFEDNFDGGSADLGPSWLWAHPDQTVAPLTNTTKLTGFVGPVSGEGLEGSFGVMLGKLCDDGPTANALDLHLDLAGQSDVFLSFWSRDFFDENNAQDGLFFSDDGGANFTKVYSFLPQNYCDNNWGQFPPFSIDELAEAADLNLTSRFVIRIQQYDDADFNTSFDEDGLIIDNVRVFSKTPFYATLPFKDNFDEGTGVLSANWRWTDAAYTMLPLTNTSKPSGWVNINSGWGTDGSFGLAMGKRCDDGLTSNALDLFLDLSEERDVFLTFSLREFFEENHSQDGLFFSDDGGRTFEKIYTFTSQDWCDDVWGEFPPFHIDQLAEAAGLELTGEFVVRFQQYDDADFNTSFDEDGFILDNVNVYSQAPAYAQLPFADDFDDGAGILSPNWRWSNAASTLLPLTNTAKPSGFVGIVNGWGTENSFGLALGKRCDDGLTSNAVDLFLNLAEERDVFLSFSIRDFFEEDQFQDAMFLSDDGGETFTKVFTFTPAAWCDDTWGEFPPFSIDQLANDAGLELTDRFVVRFQQYDDADFNTSFDEDGLILDNVRVYSRTPEYASLPFCDDFDDGTGELSLNWAWSSAEKTVAPLTGTFKPSAFVAPFLNQNHPNAFGLYMGKRCDDGFTANAADLFLDLAETRNVELTFTLIDFFEEAQPVQEGIFFSNDGGLTFTKIYNFDFANLPDNVYIDFPPLDLDALTSVAGLNYTNRCVIRFQQYDDADFNTSFDEDGIVIDNVNVYASGISCAVGVGDFVNEASLIDVFPNPSRGQLNLQSSRPNLGSASVQLLNLSGQLVHTQSTNLTQNPILDFNTLDLNGLYILRIQGSNFTLTEKVIFKQ